MASVSTVAAMMSMSIRVFTLAWMRCCSELNNPSLILWPCRPGIVVALKTRTSAIVPSSRYPRTPRAAAAPSSLKSTVHETGSMTRRLGPMIFIPMMLCATSLVTIIAADSGLPFR
jgi:hypothetical protein